MRATTGEEQTEMADHQLLRSVIGGRYKLHKLIGVGSFASVFQAIELTDGARVAIKCIRKPSGVDRIAKKERIQREIECLKTLGHHPSIVGLLHVFDSTEYIFLVLERCEMDLYEAITEKERFPPEVVKEVFLQVVSAVQECHTFGIYHRDIKPENILVANDYTIRLADFGLATVERMSTEKGTGSARYLCPENMAHDEEDDTFPMHPRYGVTDSAKGDVWALGVILINLLFGKNPWHSASPSDPIYHAFAYTDPDILKSIFKLTPRMNSLLKRIFDVNPHTRITLDDLAIEFEEIVQFTTDEKIDTVKHTDSARTVLCDSWSSGSNSSGDSLSRNHYDPPIFPSQPPSHQKPITVHHRQTATVDFANNMPSPITPKEFLDRRFQETNKQDQEAMDDAFGLGRIDLSDNTLF